MKLFYFITSLLLVVGCNTASTVTNNPSKDMVQSQKKTICPEEGSCTVKAIPNKSLNIKEDGIGKIYPEITDGENIIIHFSFLRKAPEGIADGNYSEEIYFEIPSNQNSLQKENLSLKDVNLIFGRHFFSPEAGFFIINKGELSLNRKDNQISFDLKFQAEEGRQLIEHISEVVELE